MCQLVPAGARRSPLLGLPHTAPAKAAMPQADEPPRMRGASVFSFSLRGENEGDQVNHDQVSPQPTTKADATACAPLGLMLDELATQVATRHSGSVPNCLRTPARRRASFGLAPGDAGLCFQRWEYRAASTFCCLAFCRS